jgi:hypothetical protein
MRWRARPAGSGTRCAVFLGNSEEKARAHSCLGQGRARPGLSHRRGGEPMSLASHGTSARQKSGEPSSQIGQAANRRCQSRSISENCVSSGLVSTKLRRPDTSAASCCCELSHTACRNSPGAASAQSRSASSAGLHSSSRKPEMPQCGLARS